MNDFFKQHLSRFSGLWAGWSIVQKAILVGIAVAVLGGMFALLRVSAMPTLVNVIDAPIRDEAALDRIVTRHNQEGVRVHVTANGVVQVVDEPTARRMRAILISENLIPTGIDPWQVFDRERWTITDFERNVNFQRAQTQLITDHIRALHDVDNAIVNIVWPERELFRADQNPVSVSVTIVPRPGSYITQSPQNRRIIEGIQRILQTAIEGLRAEHITITDNRGVLLNDFAGMEGFDRLALIEGEGRHRQREEARIRANVLQSLQATFTADRVRDLNVSVQMDMSRMAVETTEFFPFQLRPRTPGLPFDDSIYLESVMRSQSRSETEWQGTGFNPEGPSGVEGHTPPAFRDMQNLHGRMSQETLTENRELNERRIQEERSPQVDRVTVSVNIDGRWRKVFDERGNPVVLADGSIEREFIPVSDADLRSAQLLIQDAIGFNPARGDSVTVRNIPFDRTMEHRAEDAAFFRQQQISRMIVIFLAGLTLLVIGFLIFRIISREIERRRRLAEEERARREQMLRESAMAEAEQDGMNVSVSVEERARMELMENVVNMAKEHPEDAAQLIRTWILED